MKTNLTPILTEKAALPLGHYSQGIIHNNVLYTSGQIGCDPTTQQLIGSSLEEEVNFALNNLTAVIHAANATLNDVIKTTLYLMDISQFDAINTCYQAHFQDHRPARSLIEVSALPKGAQFEIEAVVAVS